MWPIIGRCVSRLRPKTILFFSVYFRQVPLTLRETMSIITNFVLILTLSLSLSLASVYQGGFGNFTVSS